MKTLVTFAERAIAKKNTLFRNGTPACDDYRDEGVASTQSQRPSEKYNQELLEREAQVMFSYREHEWEADLSRNKLWKKHHSKTEREQMHEQAK
jgi:hypothetical protein